jgi:uncharacterized membrane protein
MMRAHRNEEMVENYLGRLRKALRSMSAKRRDQIVSDLAQHIAEALAEEPNADEQVIGSLLDRIGTPEEIAAALAETSEDERNRVPYDPPTAGPQPPSSIRAATRLMYVGAAMSIVTAFVDFLSRSGLKVAIEKGTHTAARLHGLPRLTTSQLNSSVTDNLAMAIVVSMVSVLLWVFVARASTDGQWSARVTASGLFGLDTLILLIGPADLSLRGARVPAHASLPVHCLADRARCDRASLAESF